MTYLQNCYKGRKRRKKVIAALLALCLIVLILYKKTMRPAESDSAAATGFPQNNTTIITAFYIFPKSKHSPKDYEYWISNFLPKATTSMVIFTEQSHIPMLSKFRRDLPTKFIPLPIWELPWMSPQLHQRYIEMHGIDPEKQLHSPELYALWNSKPWMVQNVSEENPFNSTYFYWMDIGSVRRPRELGPFPSLEKSIHVFGRDERDENFKKIHFFAVDSKLGHHNGSFEKMKERSFIEGGFFGGTRIGLKWYKDVFYKTHDRFLEQGKFVGKDQELMNWIVMDEKENANVLISSYCTKECLSFWDRYKVDEWFYFLDWYDVDTVRCKIPRVWNAKTFLQEDDCHFSIW